MRFSVGDINESLSIMREAAQWLADSGKPMWNLDDLVPERFRNPPEEFIVMWDGAESVATLILSFEDSFFWPEIPAGNSGFIHKLSVRRKYAGRGNAERLIGCAAQLCKEKGICTLRLDCDANRKELCAFYEKAGFRCQQIKNYDTKRLGSIGVALYIMDIP